MSSPSNPNQPGRSSGNPESRPGVSPTDPTRTQWSQPAPQPPAQPARAAVSPSDPTLTQGWAAGQAPGPQPAVEPLTPPSGHPSGQPSSAKKRRSGSRSLFWPGFALGFLLLAAVSCGVLTAALGFNRLTLDDIRGANGPAWTPMPVTPTVATAADPVAGGDPLTAGASTRFAAGETAANVTNSRVNIRLTPGYLGKGTDDVIGQLAAGQTVQILGDAALADELTWWRVQSTDGQAIVGWVAEATASGVQILGSAP